MKLGGQPLVALIREGYDIFGFAPEQRADVKRYVWERAKELEDRAEERDLKLAAAGERPDPRRASAGGEA